MASLRANCIEEASELAAPSSRVADKKSPMTGTATVETIANIATVTMSSGSVTPRS
jgi:hypothetical protein